MWPGILFDVGGILLVALLAWLESRRGFLAAGLDFMAMVVALVLFPVIGPGLASGFGGGLDALAIVAVVLLVVALLFSWGIRWMFRHGREPGAKPGGSSRLGGALVGALEGGILFGSAAVLLVYAGLTVPSLDRLGGTSFSTRMANHYEPAIRRLLLGGEQPEDPVKDSPGAEPPEGRPEVEAAGQRPEGGTEGGEASTGLERSQLDMLAELESIQLITDDPALMEAIKQGNYAVLMSHPRIAELWEDDRFRRFIARVDTRKLMEESERMQRLGADYEKAILAFADGQLEEALAAAERVLAEDESYGNVLVVKGQILQGLERHEEAAATWQRASELYAEAAEPPYLLAELAADRGDHEEAIRLYTESLRRNPEFHYAANNRGILLFGAGRYLEALADLRQALEIEEKLALGSGDGQLRATYAEATRILHEQSDRLMGEVRRDREVWERVRDWHEQFVAGAEGQLPAHRALATVMFVGVVEQDRIDQTPAALATLQRAIDVAAEAGEERAAAELRAWKGIVLLRRGNVHEARELLSDVLSSGAAHPAYAADVFCELAIHCASRGSLDTARRLQSVALGILEGGRGPLAILKEKYGRVDPDFEPLHRDDVEEFVIGVQLTFRGQRGQVEYVAPDAAAEAASAPRMLVPKDVLLEIDGLPPLWPNDVPDLMRVAMSDPPVELLVARSFDGLESLEVEVAIQAGFQLLDWTMRWRFDLPDDLELPQ